jgi:PAS domain S-box-containing protein
MMGATAMLDLPPHAHVDVADRLEFETLIADTSAVLMVASPEQANGVIEQALDRVRAFFDADRCALLQVNTPHHVASVRLASNAEGVAPVPSDVNLAEVFPWATHRLLVERLPVRISRLDDLPPEARPERPRWEAMGIRSSLVIPVETGAEVHHLIAIQTVHREHDWPDALVTRVRVLGDLFVGCLERNATIDGLREAEASLKSGADLAGLAHYAVDYPGKVVLADVRFYEICGTPPDARDGLDAVHFWVDHIHPDDRTPVFECRKKLHDGTLQSFSTEYRYLHPSGEQRWIHHLAGATRRDASGRLTHSYGVFRDITEHVHAEEGLADLSRRLIRAQEEERAMIARELHDDVTQRLAVLAIDAGRAETEATDGKQAATLRAIREELAHVSEDVHALAYQLHSSVLDELGLGEALRTASERLRRRSPIEVSLDIDPTVGHIGKDAGLCLFRVAQEALNNVARHASARRASLVLRGVDGGVLLAIRDDGVGFDSAGTRPARSLGLAGMRERVRLVNGTLDVESAPGQGTAIVAWVPAQDVSR